MSKHYASCERDDWMSPPDAIERVVAVRPIALDPCAPVDPANWHGRYNINGEGVFRLPYEIAKDMASGLKIDWAKITYGVDGLVFVNPPYGGRRRVIDAWIEKCAAESARGAEIIGLVPASTGSNWFRILWQTADAICFVKGRLGFIQPATGRPAPQLRLFDGGEDVATTDDKATFWSAMPYWGNDVERFHEAFDGYGEVVEPRGRKGRAEKLLGKVASLIAEFDSDMVEEPDRCEQVGR